MRSGIATPCPATDRQEQRDRPDKNKGGSAINHSATANIASAIREGKRIMTDHKLTGEGVTPLGDREIAILIPARYGDRTLIKGDLREQAATHVRKELSNLAGGASGRDERLAREERLAGSFKDDAGYIVDEPVLRIYAKVADTFLTNEEKKSQFVSLARDLCGQLKQQAIGAEWDGFLYFVGGRRSGGLQRSAFRELREDLQRDYLFVTLRRTQSVKDIAYLLFLDRWTIVDNPRPHPTLGLTPVCRKEGRTAWIAHAPLTPAEKRSITQAVGGGGEGDPHERDLIFSRGGTEDPFLQVWMCQREEVRGGRRLYLVDPEGRIRRTSYELARSLLGATNADDLAEVIDRERLTAYFFQEYQRLRDDTAGRLASTGMPRDEANREAQLLLGRIMFLRFLERKGILQDRNDYLRQMFRTRQGNYYRQFLDPLFFEVLDVAHDKRATDSPMPFLNGGLFRPPSKRGFRLPDKLFDPDVRGSILNVFYRFEFTLHEGATAEAEVSVDPSMFGLVLESLCDPDRRKQKGIHYTPETIASALAFESIVSRLAERAEIDLNHLREFALGRTDAALREEEADRLVGKGNLDGELFGLRILDPAVGSGSLLLAALRVLLDLFRRCKGVVGEEITPGKRSWSEAARKFVRECLFGVDIDRDAVEVARLRLWLALAIADDQVRPLPDLTYNIRVGDSLSRLSDPEAERATRNGRVLEWTAVEKAENAFVDALQVYRCSDAADSREAAEAVEAAERNLLIVRKEAEVTGEAGPPLSKLRSSEALPFLWGVHYRDVFEGPNKGFDVIIANPPYVRIHNLPAETLQEYKRFASMRLRNRDLYLAFVERALDLGGKSGRIAFIIPNFARTQAALLLRRLIAERGAIDQWVDFTDVQVFPTAANYVSLMFARTKKRAKLRTFACRVIEPDYWKDRPDDWLYSAPQGTVPYREKWGHLDCKHVPPVAEAADEEGNEDESIQDAGDNRQVTCPGVWRTNPKGVARRLLKLETASVPLGSLARVTIGIQTSKDDIFLLKQTKATAAKISVESRHLDDTVIIEKSALVRCAKGSEHLKPFRLVGDLVWCLWPYDSTGVLLPAKEMKKRRGAWAYLKQCESALRQREKGRFDNDDKWYGFRRPHGVVVAPRTPKIIVPSMMKSATAYLDRDEGVCFTTSGTGGGGAWGVELFPDETRVTAEWLVAVLNSEPLWEWLTWEGDRKQGGWRGVDHALLRRVPVPVPAAEVQAQTGVIVRQLLATPADEDLSTSSLAELNRLVWEAYAVLHRRRPKNVS
jgi:hypothetical protein